MHKGPTVRNKPRKRNKDGTWRKKRSDAGKKRGLMSSNERDTQFFEWAELVWSEIETAIRQDPGFIPESKTRRIMFLHMVQAIIARRTYDLSQFIVSQAFEDELVPEDILYKNGKPVLMYPENLAEWYKEKS